MPSFPTISSGAVTRYPLTRTTVARTTIFEFVNGSEQRIIEGKGSQLFRLQFDRLKTADMLTVRTFFEDRKGGFDQTWDITIGAETITNCYFDGDEFSATEASEGLWAVSLDVSSRP
jgi:hypothetical protein